MDGELEVQTRFALPLAGRSSRFLACLREAGIAATSAAPLLITGEPGSGKTLLAHHIHAHSPRAKRVFVDFGDWRALPSDLMEWELFGQAPGGFCPPRNNPGLIAAADGGTLLISPLGCLSLPCQSRLVRLCQTKTYWRIGSPEQRTADVHLIAESSCDLRVAVEAQCFRNDLLELFQQRVIRVPSLSERREDIAEMARHFCVQTCLRNRTLPIELANDVVRRLEEADWPDNVRQLKQTVEVTVSRALAERAARADLSHLTFIPAAPRLEEWRKTDTDLPRALVPVHSEAVVPTTSRSPTPPAASAPAFPAKPSTLLMMLLYAWVLIRANF